MSSPRAFFSSKKIIAITLALLLSVAALVLFGKLYSSPDGQFPKGTLGLAEAKEAEIVTLADGDEYDLTASYVVKEIGNRRVRMIAYNGSVPGPFIKVEQGGEVTINFTNNLDIETTIHSHGIRLDNEFDGTPDITQDPVAPGETFTYKLKFPDGGTYWYHPHVREDYAQELGAYGNYQVVPKEYNLPPVNRELNLIVDDILFDGDELYSFYRDRTNFALMGRFGNVMLVNGRTDYSEELKTGDVVRMNITNTANARPFELSIPNAKIKLVASDLSPYEKEEYIDKILITPSERYIIDVYFEKPGTYKLIHESHDRAIGDKKYEMAIFNVSGETEKSYLSEFSTLHEYENVIAAADLNEEYLYKKPDRTITLDLDPGKVDLGTSTMKGMPCHMMPNGTWMGQCTDDAKQAWLAGDKSTGSAMLSIEKVHWEDHTFELNKDLTNRDITWEMVDDTTHQINNKINTWKFDVGDVIKLRIFNDPMSAHPMQHPIHFHGQRMMAIAVNGEEIQNKVWKDSILIPVGDTVDIMVEMSNPGIWMAHCHIAEHLSSGMMFNFAVGEQYFDMLGDVEDKMHDEHI